jgi:hypothetical protein
VPGRKRERDNFYGTKIQEWRRRWDSAWHPKKFSVAAVKPKSFVATESHRDSLLLRMRARGLDIAAAVDEGRYIALDAPDTLSTFMVNDQPAPSIFQSRG